MRRLSDKVFFATVFAFSVSAPGLAAAANSYEIYTYGSGQFVASLFTALNMLLQGGYVFSLIKVFLLIGLVAAILRPILGMIGPGNLTPHFYGGEPILIMIRQVLIAAIAVYVLTLPRTNVLITDRLDASQNAVVGDVPLVTVVIAHVSSTIGDRIGRAMDDTITATDEMRFRNGGVALGAKYMNEILDIQPPAAAVDYNAGSNTIPVNAVLVNYFETCVFPNFVHIPGPGSPEAQAYRAITASTDLLHDPAFYVPKFADPNKTLDISFSDGLDQTCQNALNDVISQWNAVFMAWLTRFNYQTLGAGSTSDPGNINAVQAIFTRYFPDSNPSGYENQIAQIATINAIRSAALAYSLQHGASGNMQDQLMEKKTGSGWIEAARLFNKIVITMRQLFEGLVYGMAAFLPIFFAIAGLQALVTYAKINLWLQMWVPFYVIMNAFADSQFAKVVGDALYNPNYASQGLSFETVEAVRTQANLVLGYIGAFSWSVPTLAWGVIKGGEYAISHAVSAATSGSGGQASATSVGAEVGGAGNTSVGNRSFANTSTMTSTGHSSGAALAAGTAESAKWSQLSKQFGGSGAAITAAGTAAAISSERNISDQMAFAEVAAKRGITSGQLQSNVSTMDAGAKDQMVADYAVAKGVSRDQAAQELGKLTADQGFVDRRQFEGARDQVGGTQNLANMQYGMGAMSGAETESAINTIRDWGQQQGLSASETFEMFGAAKAVGDTAGVMALAGLIKGGNVTPEDVRSWKETGLLTEGGRAEGARALGEVFARGEGRESSQKDVMRAQGYLSTREGMNEFAKFKQIEGVAAKAGISDQFQTMMAHQGSVHMNLNKQQAESFFGKGAQAGDYTISRSNDGFIARSEGKGGQHYSFLSGKSRISEDVGKHISDHRSVVASGTQFTSGKDYSVGNDILAAVNTGDGKYLSGYSQYFEGKQPTAGGRAVVKGMASELGGYGKITQAIQDVAALEGGVGFNLSHSLIGQVFGIKAGASFEAQRRALEGVDANTVRSKLDNFYDGVMAQNQSVSWKMQQLAQLGKEIKSITDHQATANTLAQFGDGAFNPAKNQFPPDGKESAEFGIAP